MLKPTKKNTKKEIQSDPFLDTVGNAQAHFEHNKTLYTQIITGFLVLVAGFMFLSNKNKVHIKEGNAALGNALVAIDQDDLSNAKFQLETVFNDYSDTKPSYEAAYFLGKIYFEEEDFDLAKKYITTFKENSNNEMLLVASAKMLSDIEEQNNNIENAIEFIKDSKKKVNLASQKNSLELDEARLLISSGLIDNAKKKLNSILNLKDIPNNQKQIAEELLGQISS